MDFVIDANVTGECQCIWLPMYWWNEFTPQFELVVILVSSPFTLLVALWGMTSARARQVHFCSSFVLHVHACPIALCSLAL